MALVLQILKVIGIILLCILALLILILSLVLFVPIRYRLKGERRIPDDAPVRARMKVTWLLHLLSVTFSYPEAAYIQVKVLGIRVFSTQEKEESGKTEKKEKKKSGTDENSKTDRTEEKGESRTKKLTQKGSSENVEKKQKDKVQEENTGKAPDRKTGDHNKQKGSPEYDLSVEAQEDTKEDAENEEKPTLIGFFRKLWQKLKNIKYTIKQIYDKIKEIIKNIRYYIAVIQSETFQRAFLTCKEEAFYLLKSILPRKFTGNFVVGTGDPASTAQILAVHGILYPIIGNHITITPDFENTIITGDFFIKGKITVFKVLKVAITVYFNKDLRKVIRLLKREAKVNGRK